MDIPINTAAYTRNKTALEASIYYGEKGLLNIKCVHGHFLPLKYLLMASNKPVKFVTWMRDPVDRILSHYYYWKKPYNPTLAAPFRRKVFDEDWSIENFCFCKELRNLYYQFLWGFPIDNFDFIGVTEFYDQDLLYFCELFLHSKPEVKHLNVNLTTGGKYKIKDSLRNQIEQYHEKDVNLYQLALAKRLARAKY